MKKNKSLFWKPITVGIALLILGCEDQITAEAQFNLLVPPSEMQTVLGQVWLILPVLSVEGKEIESFDATPLVLKWRPAQKFNDFKTLKGRWTGVQISRWQAFRDSVALYHSLPDLSDGTLAISSATRVCISFLVRELQLSQIPNGLLERRLVLEIEAWDNQSGQKLFAAKSAAITQGSERELLVKPEALFIAAMAKFVEKLPFNALESLRPATPPDWE